MRPITSVTKRILKTSACMPIILILGLYLISLMRNPEQITKSAENPLFLFASKDRDFAAPGAEKLVFPGDHGIHPLSGIEIWQLVGHLETMQSARFGFEITCIRVDLGNDLNERRSAWATDQIFHLSYAITPFSHGEIYRDGETSRRAMGLAGYDQEKQKIWVYKRELKFDQQHPEFAGMELNIPDSAYPVKLKLSAAEPVVSPAFSIPFRYYAITRLAAKGTLKISGETHAVRGAAFFDHSWGKLPTGSGQLVRNRFLLQLSNGIDISLLQSRRRDGTGNAVNSGFMVLAEAKSVALEPGDLNIESRRYWNSQASGIRYPVEWRIRIPEQFMVLDLKPWMDDQETSDSLINWTGMVSISGHVNATPVQGFGHVQLSGYAPPKRN
jgi:predicted secreted hydrolase